MILSRGARLCESIIRAARARRGGRRECGRPYLARRLGCSVRTVSRYIRELREAGRLVVVPPPKVRTSKGWRTRGVNTYQLEATPNPAPHVTGRQRLRRSGRDATGVTPPPTGSGAPAHEGPVAASGPLDIMLERQAAAEAAAQASDQAAGIASVRAALAQSRQRVA